MKKVLLLFMFINMTLLASAQFTAKDVFIEDEIVWYGLDFSKAKMIGKFDRSSGKDVNAKLIPAWNSMILDEASKYDFKAALKKKKVHNDIAMVEKMNADIDEDDLFTSHEYKFEKPKETVAGMVKNYGTGKRHEGIGLVFIVESFNKEEQLATVYVTFFDIGTKAVLFKKKLEGKPGGFGIRNYWLGAIYKIMKDIEKDEYKAWKRTYMS
jgi:hypothetical protein